MCLVPFFFGGAYCQHTYHMKSFRECCLMRIEVKDRRRARKLDACEMRTDRYRAGRRGHWDGVTTDPITKINATLYFEHAISLLI
jgi:hypothetical protein